MLKQNHTREYATNEQSMQQMMQQPNPECTILKSS